jgi:4-coumarate--CoA ligase
MKKRADFWIVPQKTTVWDWLFDSLYSPLERFEDHELKGYQNAVTKERVNWRQVKEYSTYISTALVKKYGLKEGQTVSLFSQNSIWYPVVMLGALRAGTFFRFFRFAGN